MAVLFIIGMSGTHRKALRISRPGLLKSIHVNETFLSVLVSNGDITNEMKEEIDAIVRK